jgi:hypothetical protein
MFGLKYFSKGKEDDDFRQAVRFIRMTLSSEQRTKMSYFSACDRLIYDPVLTFIAIIEETVPDKHAAIALQ